MFLGISILGNSFLTNVFPERNAFTSFKVNGELIVDELHVRDGELTDAEILALNSEEPWGTNTNYLAHFNGNLDAGNYSSLLLPIYKYRIQRKKITEFQYDTLGEVLTSEGISYFNDYTAKNYQEYEYGVFPVATDGTIGSSFTTTVAHDFFGWFLIDDANTMSYKFDTEFDSGDLKTNTDVKIYDNYTKYTYTSQGKRDYVSSSITTMPISLNGCDIIFNESAITALRNFINNKEEKYLKNTNGEIFKVWTYNFSYKYMDKVKYGSGQPYTISFDFVQVGAGE